MDIQKFLEIEKKYDLYHKKVVDIEPWLFVRFDLWNYKICTEQLGLSAPFRKLEKSQQLGRIIKGLLYLLFHPQNREIKEADVCFICHERRVKNDDTYECIYTNELVERYYPDSMVLEKPFQMQHMRPVSTKNLYYTDLISIKSNIYYQIHYKLKTNKYKRIQTEVTDAYEQALVEIGKVCNCTLNIEQIKKSLIKIVIESIYLKKVYTTILKKINPKVLVEVVGYSKQCMLMNQLAKEMGITTIELQHGTMHADHAAYQYAKDCGTIAQFPDVIFTFSDYWKRCIHVPIDESNIVAVGYPYFERKIEQYPKVPHDKKTILFISQGTIGTELSKLAAELFRLLDSSEYRIIYKLHPEEYSGWRDNCPWLCQEGIEVVDSLEHNIYEYFAQSDIQVGAYSTAIYEGLGFGLQTYIYQVGHADTMKELCEQGYATWVRSVEELSDLIKANTGVEQPDTEGFWKRNALQNMKDEISKF